MSSLLCFNLLAISKYRTELMGLAAIGIIACHANGNYVMMPIWLNKICGLGQLGVNVFFFLSGLGIWFSLQKVIKHKPVGDGKLWRWGGVIDWYLTRYKKLFIPFLLLSIPCFAYQTILGGNSIWYFITQITTIEFWISGGGAWFVYVLIVLYLILPWWNLILLRTRQNAILSIIIYEIN